MGLIALCSAALLGLALGDLNLLPFGCLGLLACGAALTVVRWRTLAGMQIACSLGGLRALLPPITLPLAPPEALADLRAAAQAGIAAWLPEPQASLAAGVLLGGSGHLDTAFKLDLQRSGLSHVVAIDGFKEVVVAGAVLWLLGRVFGRKLGLLASMLAIAAYTVLAGAHPSAVRAALMVGMAHLAALGGRVPDPLSSLLLATLGMALVDPRVLLEVSLQLSVSATLGIVLLWPGLRRARLLSSLPRCIAEPVGLTLAVSLATLPVALSTFQMVSLISPVTHILAVPMLPLVLASSLVLAAFAWFPPLGALAAWVAWVPTTLLARVIELGGSLPGAAVSTGRPPVGVAVALALALLALGVWHQPELSPARSALERWWVDHRRLAVPSALGGACLCLASILSVLRPDGQVHVEPLALGRGQAVFVRAPSGRTALVVLGGVDGAAVSTELSAHLAVWEHHVEAVVALDTTAQKAIAPVLRRYPPDQLVQATSAEVDLGGGELLEIEAVTGQLRVIRSAPTTSAARPGSAG